jgi:hypothetical protein
MLEDLADLARQLREDLLHLALGDVALEDTRDGVRDPLGLLGIRQLGALGEL